MILTLLLSIPAPALADEPAAPAETYEVLVLYPASPSPELQKQLALLSEILTYMGRKTCFVRSGGAEEWPLYTAAIVLLDDRDSLPEDEARLLSRREALVLGSGGLRDIAAAAGLPAPEAHTGESIQIHTLLPGGEEDNRYEYAPWMLTLADDGKGEDAAGGWVRVAGEAHPLIATNGKLSHMAWFDAQNNALAGALATFIQSWMWPWLDSPPAYAQYVVLNDVYPFFDPNQLMAVHDLLEAKGVPYVISVMPLFQNAEFPAMQRFCEFLRYAQSRGASIVLRCPQVRVAEVQPEELMRHLDIAYGAYAQYGVYPVGLEAPTSWLYDETGILTLRRFRTGLLFKTDEPGWAPGMATNAVWQDGHVLIAPAFGVGSRVYASTSAFSSAVYLDAREDAAALEAQLDSLLRARVQLGDLTKVPASVYLNEHSYTTVGGKPLYLGKAVSLRYEPFAYDDHFAYGRGLLGAMRRQLLASNRAVTFFTIAACLLFFVFLWRGRLAARRDLYHRKGGHGK